LLAVHVATDQHIGPQHIFPLYLGKPRFEPWGFQAHAPPDNGDQSPARCQQLEGFFHMPCPDEGIVLALLGCSGEGRIHQHDGGLNPLRFQETVEIQGIFGRQIAKTQMLQGFLPTWRNLINMHLVMAYSIRRKHGQGSGASTRLQDNIRGLQIGDPGCRIGIVERGAELLELVLFSRAHGMRGDLLEQILKCQRFTHGPIFAKARVDTGSAGAYRTMERYFHRIVEVFRRKGATAACTAIGVVRHGLELHNVLGDLATHDTLIQGINQPTEAALRYTSTRLPG
jgi:hypothetical protein